MLQARPGARTAITKTSRDLMRLATEPSRMHTGMILERLYRFPLHRRSWRNRLRSAQRALSGWVRSRSALLSIGSVVFGAWLVSHIYYFNRLVLLESDIGCARAQIDAVEQKRNHIQRNLLQLLRYYADYERGVLNETTQMRTKHGPPGAPIDPAGSSESLTELLARLNAVAEQYPNLNLGKNVQQISESIINTEGDIAKRIMVYNDAVNTYTNVLATFPGDIFGHALGFKNYEFYKPHDPSILEYHEIKP